MNRIFDSELVRRIRDFFTSLGERLSDIRPLNYSPSKRVITVGFCVVVLLLSLTSAFFVIGEINNNKQEHLLTTETTEPEEAAANMPTTKEIDSTFLFAMTDNGSTVVRGVFVVTFNSEAERLDFRFVNPDAYETVNEKSCDMHTHLSEGGTSEFLWAVSSYTGIGFNRYLIIKESDFVKLVSLIGDTEIEIERSISYDHDGISFIIDKGTRTLTADMMLKYWLYLSSNQDANADKIMQTFIIILQQLFSAESDELFQSRFSSALGLFTTDISAIDFSEHRDAIRRIPQMKLSENTHNIAE